MFNNFRTTVTLSKLVVFASLQYLLLTLEFHHRRLTRFLVSHLSVLCFSYGSILNLQQSVGTSLFSFPMKPNDAASSQRGSHGGRIQAQARSFHYFRFPGPFLPAGRSIGEY